MYAVKEIFYTLQGEGVQAGRPAVFCRFAGCNLWSGREADREVAICTFCDTDFVGTEGPDGGKFIGAEALARQVVGFLECNAVQADCAHPCRALVDRFDLFADGAPLLMIL